MEEKKDIELEIKSKKAEIYDLLCNFYGLNIAAQTIQNEVKEKQEQLNKLIK